MTVHTFTPDMIITVQQALLSAMELSNSNDLQEVLIIGYDGDRNMIIRSSRMSRETTLWFAENLRDYALEGPKPT